MIIVRTILCLLQYYILIPHTGAYHMHTRIIRGAARGHDVVKQNITERRPAGPLLIERCAAAARTKTHAQPQAARDPRVRGRLSRISHRSSLLTRLSCNGDRGFELEKRQVEMTVLWRSLCLSLLVVVLATCCNGKPLPAPASGACHGADAPLMTSH